MIRSSGLESRYQASFTNGSDTATADVPVEKGGAGQGFGPHHLLEAALATCLTMTARMYADDHGLPLAGVRSEVRIDRSVPGEAALNYSIEFDGELSGEQVRRLREAVSRCPVAKTLTGKLVLRADVPVA
jgi:putative redox protein